MKNKFETIAVRTQTERSQFREHSTPLHLTSSYLFDDSEQMRAMFADEVEGNIYSRFSNPNVTELIEKICLMEQADSGWATATGMAAVFTTLGALLKSGDHVVACRSIFGSTHTLLTKILPKWNIDHTYVEINEVEKWSDAILPNTKILFIETPTNPANGIVDLELVGNLARKHNLILVVDNTFATPYIQQPIKFGANVVIHSATKYLDGQGRVLGGVIVGEDKWINEIKAFARHTGPALSPFNAWTISKSLETLAIRMDKHSSNALELAKWLEGLNKVEEVSYPFLESHPQFKVAKSQMKLGGGVLSFILRGGIEKGKSFMDNLKLISLTANLGDSRTIATHPASTTHSKLSFEEREETGISDGLIRVSVGLEDIEDIKNDILQAMNDAK